jgi:hypothetical protein
MGLRGYSSLYRVTTGKKISVGKFFLQMHFISRRSHLITGDNLQKNQGK